MKISLFYEFALPRPWSDDDERLLFSDGLDEVAAKLPFYESNKISDEDWRARIALRQKLIGERMVG